MDWLGKMAGLDPSLLPFPNRNQNINPNDQVENYHTGGGVILVSSH